MGNFSLLAELGPLMAKYHLAPAQLESVLSFGTLRSEEITADVITTIGGLLGFAPTAGISDDISSHIRGTHPEDFADWVGKPGNLTWVMKRLSGQPVSATQTDGVEADLMVCPLCFGCFEVL